MLYPAELRAPVSIMLDGEGCSIIDRAVVRVTAAPCRAPATVGPLAQSRTRSTAPSAQSASAMRARSVRVENGSGSSTGRSCILACSLTQAPYCQIWRFIRM
jgi:hypothetical protein